MSLSRGRALAHLYDRTKTDALRDHTRAVETVIRAAALRYGGGPSEVESLGIAGLIHDAD